MVRVPSFSVVQALTSSSAGRSLFFHDQRVITRRRHRHRKALKDGSIVVHDWAGFPVHQVRGADDASAKCFADRLMAEAHSEHRNLSREMADQVDADARFMRSARSGRNDDAFGMQCFDFFHA